MNKVVLGTVQFGLNYGISNTQGQVPLDTVKDMLDVMRSSNCKTIDTAQAYGTSEDVLGYCGVGDLDVITKIQQTTNIEDSIQGSLRRLRLDKLEAVMYHSFPLFKQDEASFKCLEKLKSDGLVNKIGFSLYDPKEAEYILDKYNFDIVQVPYNIFDRRFETVFERLKKSDVEIHVRSVYLQGLFFLSPENLPAKISELYLPLKKLQSICKDNVALYCLAFACANKFIDKIVVGATSVKELRENISYFSEVTYPTELDALSEGINSDMLNPSNWK